MPMPRLRWLITLGSSILLAACAGTPPNPNPLAQAPLSLAPAIDLDRYMGRWYVVANIPYFAEKGFVGSYVEYRRRPDGKIDDVFYGHKKRFDAPLTSAALKDTVVEGTHNAEWRASPFWPVSFDYPILYVDDDYQVALIGYPDKGWGWIFSRSPELGTEKYLALLKHFESQGYDTSRFQRIPQRESQMGLPGFQTPAS